MNEKIEELAKQAGGRIRNVCYGHGDYVDEFQLSKSKNIEKFAELIIQECMRVCTQENPDPRDSIELQCSNRIKQHFGIE